jgi:anti-sigma factor RsiW
MAGCIEPQMLGAYADGRLTPERSAAVEAHLERCRRCAGRIGRRPEDIELLERIRDAESTAESLRPTLRGLRELEERVRTTLFAP